MIFENFSEKISSLKHVSKDLNLEEVSQKFEMYFNILVEENEKYNLTAITEKEEVYLKHFYDSLFILNYFCEDFLYAYLLNYEKVIIRGNHLPISIGTIAPLGRDYGSQ